MGNLAKLVALFEEGKEVVLETGSTKIVLWVAKLNTFQEEQANQNARIARARAMLAIREVGSDAYDFYKGSIAGKVDDALIEAVVTAKESESLMRVIRDLRADPAWKERIEILEFTEKPKDAAEEKLLIQLETSYRDEVIKRLDDARDTYREDLKLMSREHLEEAYLEAYVEEQGMVAFSSEKLIHQTYQSLRICDAKPPADGAPWDHTGCDHSRYFLAIPEEVTRLPQSIRDKVALAYAEIVVPSDLARFTDALPSSSDSPELSDSEEESTPSGPEGAPLAPVTTS